MISKIVSILWGTKISWTSLALEWPPAMLEGPQGQMSQIQGQGLHASQIREACGH